MKRIAFYGGSFDPIHQGHLAIAEKLVELFEFDEFYFIPAFHAPHKKGKRVSSAFCRYAMLALATNNISKIRVSTIELEAPEKPFTIETLTKLKNHYATSANIFFVMGADSWNEIDTWRNWEELLTLTNFVVVTRPNVEITTNHVTPKISEKIVDMRGLTTDEITSKLGTQGIFLTNAVQLDISATSIRQQVSLQNDAGWRKLVPAEVVNYIEKYRLYQ
ncbi:MAG: nicotinate-nucleotide adenylyltransferase [Pyrinomonadaceae bacterium]